MGKTFLSCQLNTTCKLRLHRDPILSKHKPPKKPVRILSGGSPPTPTPSKEHSWQLFQHLTPAPLIQGKHDGAQVPSLVQVVATRWHWAGISTMHKKIRDQRWKAKLAHLIGVLGKPVWTAKLPPRFTGSANQSCTTPVDTVGCHQTNHYSERGAPCRTIECIFNLFYL